MGTHRIGLNGFVFHYSNIPNSHHIHNFFNHLPELSFMKYPLLYKKSAAGGIRTRTPGGHYPLKIACLPDSTTAAYILYINVGFESETDKILVMFNCQQQKKQRII